MLFKFTTTKPSAVEIWETLSRHGFKPDQGYTSDQITFTCYCVFQLIDFKESKDLVNKYITNTLGLAVLISKLGTVMPANSIIEIHTPPVNFPHFIDEKLYIPYYMLMQLEITKDSELWLPLFDRKSYTPYEEDYITANLQPITKSITLYKLWNQAPSIDFIFKAFAIDESRSPAIVEDKKDVENALQKYIQQYLEDTPIYDYSLPIQIPPFKLRSVDVPQ